MNGAPGPRRSTARRTWLAASGATLLAAGALVALATPPAGAAADEPPGWWRDTLLCLSPRAADTPAQNHRAERRRWRKEQATQATVQAATLAP